MNWETVVGLEVHVQLKTASKMFCECSTRFGDAPNTNVCPVCLGLPGALPVLNARAVALAVRAAHGLGFEVHSRSVFARKNYFYPDLPKGYQISQFDRPLATGGLLRIETDERGGVDVGITRLHIEEDAGKSFHDRLDGKTAVDFNRSGVPLAEIVSEPDMRSPAEARAYLTTLKQILEYLEVSDCNMEEGSLRVDGNVSVRPAGDSKLGVKQEVKNMNSFAGVEKALDQLRQMQIKTIEAGGVVEQQTFTAGSGEVRPMRSKEESHDYRYFPEPDLPPLVLQPEWIEEEKRELPELPAARSARFGDQYGISEYDAGVLTATRQLADYFEAVAELAEGFKGKDVANWVMNDVLSLDTGAGYVAAEIVSGVMSLAHENKVNRQAAKKILEHYAANNESDDPGVVAERLGLIQVSDDSQLEGWVSEVVEAHPDEFRRLKEGEGKLVGFFMGQVMKKSRGKADPKKVQALLRSRS